MVDLAVAYDLIRCEPEARHLDTNVYICAFWYAGTSSESSSQIDISRSSRVKVKVKVTVAKNACGMCILTASGLPSIERQSC